MSANIKSSLKQTWFYFFSRFQTLTTIQEITIPEILAKKNCVVISPTAQGKTEACVAPVCELFLNNRKEKKIIYITPTKALANDIKKRLASNLEALGISLKVRTGEKKGIKTNEELPDFLITTPESFDSLLTRNTKAFTKAGFVIIDELHLLHGTPRGTQLAITLERLRRLFKKTGNYPQFIALTATIHAPEVVVKHYFDEFVVLKAGEQRKINVKYVKVGGKAGYKNVLELLVKNRFKKILGFANSRRKTEEIAEEFKKIWSYGDRVFVHYSNLSKQERETIEFVMNTHEVAMTIATTTLELGIDIGSIDCIILFEPPFSINSYLQRIGRGNRRDDTINVIMAYKDRFEKKVSEIITRRALLGFVEPYPATIVYPGVVAQQIACYLYQRRFIKTGFKNFSNLFSKCGVSEFELSQILEHMEEISMIGVHKDGTYYIKDKLLKLIDRGYIHSTIKDSYSEYDLIDVSSGAFIGTVNFDNEYFILSSKLWKKIKTVKNKIYVKKQEHGQAKKIFTPSGKNLDISPYILLDLKTLYFGCRSSEIPYFVEPEIAGEKRGGIFYFFHFLGIKWSIVFKDTIAKLFPNGEILYSGPYFLTLIHPEIKNLDKKSVFEKESLLDLSYKSALEIKKFFDTDKFSYMAPESVILYQVVKNITEEYDSFIYNKLTYKRIYEVNQEFFRDLGK